jgi:TPR repeat protein
MFAVAGLLLLVCAFRAEAQNAPERRVALVIGNFSYQSVPRLANSGNDAKLIAATLGRLGFTLVGGGPQNDVDKAHFDQLVQAFGRAIQGADVALFYYAGHGMQVGGDNWLVPTDANPTRPQDLEFQMVNAELVLKQMDGSGTRLNIVILDACRNNPFAGISRAAGGGLAQMRAPEGTMISFATQPGNVAADGAGDDGPYALALAAAMRQPGLDIFRVFNQVGLSVKKQTDGAQLPWVSSSPIDGDFYFAQTDAAPVVNAGAVVDAAPSPARSNVVKAPADAVTPEAQIERGLAYARGEGVARDDAKARELLEAAASQGVARAQYLAGAMRESGRGGPRSYEDALQWYQRAAEQGYPAAEAAVGRFYGRGLGVPRDVAQRTSWYRRAADHGDALGQLTLGHFYQHGDGVPADLVQARTWYERAAKQNYAIAQVQVALFYERGLGGVRQDDAEAARWLRQAADAGNLYAQNELGDFYRLGRGVPRDYAQAMRLYRLSADKGFVPAQFNVGLMYAEGLGGAVDYGQARPWLEKAKAGGNAAAIAELAKIDYACGTQAQGRGVVPVRPVGSKC